MKNSEFEQKLRLIEKRLDKIEKILFNKKGKSPLKNNMHSNYKGLIGSIYDLIGQKFFDAPKELKEIQEKLKANAVFYPRTNYPDALLRLIKKKELRRLRDNKKWKYIKNG